MKIKKCHTTQILKSNIKTEERGNIDTTNTQIYMTANFPGFVQALQ
jgi:hypothetical protein